MPTTTTILRAVGIEPTLFVWKTKDLPLIYARLRLSYLRLLTYSYTAHQAPIHSIPSTERPTEVNLIQRGYYSFFCA